MTNPKPIAGSFDELPDSAYVRLPQLIPSPLPWSNATLWRKCKRGEFVAPVKLSERVTAWNVGAVRAWMREKQAPGVQAIAPAATPTAPAPEASKRPAKRLQPA